MIEQCKVKIYFLGIPRYLLNHTADSESPEEPAHLCSLITSRKHAYIVLTPLNPTFIQ